MAERIVLRQILTLLRDDRELLEEMLEAGFLPRGATHYTPEQAEIARVIDTLVHDLEVNWAGVEVIIHMRSQLLATHRQMGQVVEMLRRRRAAR